MTHGRRNPNQSPYTRLEEKDYNKLVRLVKLADARGVEVDLSKELGHSGAIACVQKLLLEDYANCKKRQAESQHQAEIERDKDDGQRVPISLSEREFDIKDFLEEAKLDLESDLKLIPENPDHQRPLQAYNKFHEK